MYCPGELVVLSSFILLYFLVLFLFFGGDGLEYFQKPPDK